MKNKIKQWLLVLMMVLFAGIIIMRIMRELPQSAGTLESLVNSSWVVMGLVFLLVAGIILLKGQTKLMGWILIGPPIAATLDSLGFLLFGPVNELPETLTTGQYLYLWFSNTGWWLLIGPILLIALLYPDGKLHGRLWRIAAWALGLSAGSFMFFVSFSTTLEDVSGEIGPWPNPVGFIPDEISNAFFPIFAVMLASTAALCLVALVRRYRDSEGVERAQMKWLFYAMSLFLVVYLLFFFFPDEEVGGALNMAFAITTMLIPIAIGIAVMRYRLWDIDLVINRSLVYGLLTALIAAVWAGSLVVIDQIITNLVGDQSKAASTVLSTLLAASVVQPARARIEKWINRRFFPEKRQLEKGFIEIEPRFWKHLDMQQVAQLAVERVCGIMKAQKGAFMVRDKDGLFKPVASHGIELSKVPAWKPDAKDMKELELERAAVWEESPDFSGYIPLFIPRVGPNEVLGLLALSERENGRGYTGDDLKALALLGSKLGEALYNLELDTMD